MPTRTYNQASERFDGILKVFLKSLENVGCPKDQLEQLENHLYQRFNMSLMGLGRTTFIDDLLGRPGNTTTFTEDQVEWAYHYMRAGSYLDMDTESMANEMHSRYPAHFKAFNQTMEKAAESVRKENHIMAKAHKVWNELQSRTPLLKKGLVSEIPIVASMINDIINNLRDAHVPQDQLRNIEIWLTEKAIEANKKHEFDTHSGVLQFFKNVRGVKGIDTAVAGKLLFQLKAAAVIIPDNSINQQASVGVLRERHRASHISDLIDKINTPVKKHIHGKSLPELEELLTSIESEIRDYTKKIDDLTQGAHLQANLKAVNKKIELAIEIEKQITAFKEQDALYAEMKRLGLESAKQFTWDNIAELIPHTEHHGEHEEESEFFHIKELTEPTAESVAALDESLEAHNESPEEPTGSPEEPSVFHTKPTVSHTEPTVSHTEPTVSHTEPTVSHTEPSVSHTEPTVSHTEPSVSHTETPVSHTETPVSHTETPVSQTETPVSQKDSPVSQKDSPVSQKDSPESQKDSPESQKDSPESHKDSPESQKDSPESHKDSPESHKDSPESHKDSPKPHKDSPESHKDSPDSHKDSSESHHGSHESHKDSSESHHGSHESHKDSPDSHHGSHESEVESIATPIDATIISGAEALGFFAYGIHLANALRARGVGALQTEMVCGNVINCARTSHSIMEFVEKMEAMKHADNEVGEVLSNHPGALELAIEHLGTAVAIGLATQATYSTLKSGVDLYRDIAARAEIGKRTALANVAADFLPLLSNLMQSMPTATLSENLKKELVGEWMFDAQLPFDKQSKDFIHSYKKDPIKYIKNAQLGKLGLFELKMIQGLLANEQGHYMEKELFRQAEHKKLIQVEKLLARGLIAQDPSIKNECSRSIIALGATIQLATQGEALAKGAATKQICRSAALTALNAAYASCWWTLAAGVTAPAMGVGTVVTGLSKLAIERFTQDRSAMIAARIRDMDPGKVKLLLDQIVDGGRQSAELRLRLNDIHNVDALIEQRGFYIRELRIEKLKVYPPLRFNDSEGREKFINEIIDKLEVIDQKMKTKSSLGVADESEQEKLVLQLNVAMDEKLVSTFDQAVATQLRQPLCDELLTAIDHMLDRNFEDNEKKEAMELKVAMLKRELTNLSVTRLPTEGPLVIMRLMEDYAKKIGVEKGYQQAINNPVFADKIHEEALTLSANMKTYQERTLPLNNMSPVGLKNLRDIYFRQIDAIYNPKGKLPADLDKKQQWVINMLKTEFDRMIVSTPLTTFHEKFIENAMKIDRGANKKFERVSRNQQETRQEEAERREPLDRLFKKGPATKTAGTYRQLVSDSQDQNTDPSVTQTSVKK